MILKTV